MIETVGYHLARRNSRKDRTQASRYANEVREILRTSSQFRFVEKGHRGGENVYSALGADKRWPLSDCVLCAQENGSSITDISAGHDRQREEKI
jgi:hypothetical protein